MPSTGKKLIRSADNIWNTIMIPALEPREKQFGHVYHQHRFTLISALHALNPSGTGMADLKLVLKSDRLFRLTWNNPGRNWH